MTALQSFLPPGLEELLQALRASGLPVGVREVTRLHRVFSLQPALSQDRAAEPQLRRLLTATLVHSPDEREVFEPVYRAWHERWTDWERAGSAPPRAPPRGLRSAPAGEATSRRRTARSRWRRGMALAGFLTVAAVLTPHPTGLTSHPIDDPPTQDAPPIQEDPFRELPLGPEPTTIDIPVPSFEVESAPSNVDSKGRRSEAGVLQLLYGFLLLVATFMLAWACLGEAYGTLPRLPEPTLAGPLRVPLLPYPESGPELLDAEGARTLVWGVGRHRTEKVTAEIDLERTVDATALTGGIPTLRHVFESRLREVWLWIDGTMADPAPERYAYEIAACLEQAGLAVRLAGFDGYPSELLWAEGQRSRPQELEGHRQTALVAVMTDGDVLLKHGHDARREQVSALLRALSSWERLAFVDGSEGRDLAVLLRSFGIPCIQPEGLPAFFGLGSARAPARAPADPGELRTWSAALALSPRAVERSEAYALRRELGLEVTPWNLGRLSPSFEAGGHLAWDVRRSAAEVTWLQVSHGQQASHGETDSVWRGAVDFWESRLEEEDRRRRERGDLEAWEQRPARRYLEMDLAFLRLWNRPAEATEKLMALAALDENLAGEIRERLGRYAATDAGEPGEDQVAYPWRLAELSPFTRQGLGELGLEVGRGRVRPAGRLGLGLGLLAGLGILLLSHGLLVQAGQEEVSLPPPGVVEADEPPREGRAFLVEAAGMIYAGTPHAIGRELAVSPFRNGYKVTVRWDTAEDQPCVLGEGEARIWRCPRPTTIREVVSWPRRRLAVVELSAAEPSARSLARTLLDGGIVDALVLGLDAADRLDELTRGAGSWQREEELLWITGLGSGTPNVGLRFSGRWAALKVGDAGRLDRALQELSSPTPVRGLSGSLAQEPVGDEEILVHYCPVQRGVHELTGMSFVRVCGGRFRMGSEDDAAPGEEKPAHDVDLTGFWIGEREVTRKEFEGRPFGEAKSADDLPVTRVRWKQARDFCKALGESDEWEYDLPTEAQWEFAARGNTGRRYPWGDEEPDEDRAVFGRGLGDSPEAVGRLVEGMGPFGTFDQAGNVWEWVRDCYDENAYAKRAGGGVPVNPVVGGDECPQTSSPYRVLRGGAFWVGPRGLRSAARGRGVPERGDWFIGFRCVRVPRRQP